MIYGRIIAAIKAGSSFSRAMFFASKLAPFLKKNGSLLDLGCGPGHIGVTLAKNHNQRVTLVDTLPYWGYFGQWLFNIPCAKELARQNGIPYLFYDGANLPFPDNVFDTVLIAFVLHHACDPETIIKEARRVSRGRIIIMEDIVSSKLAGFSRLADSLINLEFGGVHANRSKDEWLSIFSSCKLKPMDIQLWTSRLAGFKFHNIMFVLEK